MTFPFFPAGARHRRRNLPAPRPDLPPRLLRDIGLDPGPDGPRLTFHPYL